MNLLHEKPLYAELLLITAGTAGIALGIQWFYDPGGFVTGGFTGIAIITKELTAEMIKGGLPLWLTNHPTRTAARTDHSTAAFVADPPGIEISRV